MLVEDDNNLREIYQARLNSEGYETVTASDGEEALSIVGNEKPDLIILDVMMPKISGFDTLDLLKNSPVTKDIKVIMMTALSQAEDRARAEKLGAQNYLVKSQVTLEDIVKAVKDALAGSTDNFSAQDSTAPSTTSTPSETPSVFSNAAPIDEPTTQEPITITPPTDSASVPTEPTSTPIESPSPMFTPETPSLPIDQPTVDTTAQTTIEPVQEAMPTQEPITITPPTDSASVPTEPTSTPTESPSPMFTGPTLPETPVQEPINPETRSNVEPTGPIVAPTIDSNQSSTPTESPNINPQF